MDTLIIINKRRQLHIVSFIGQSSSILDARSKYNVGPQATSSTDIFSTDKILQINILWRIFRRLLSTAAAGGRKSKLLLIDLMCLSKQYCELCIDIACHQEGTPTLEDNNYQPT